jgi:hypothetical protein
MLPPFPGFALPLMLELESGFSSQVLQPVVFRRVSSRPYVLRNRLPPQGSASGRLAARVTGDW